MKQVEALEAPSRMTATAPVTFGGWGGGGGGGGGEFHRPGPALGARGGAGSTSMSYAPLCAQRALSQWPNKQTAAWGGLRGAQGRRIRS